MAVLNLADMVSRDLKGPRSTVKKQVCDSGKESIDAILSIPHLLFSVGTKRLPLVLEEEIEVLDNNVGFHVALLPMSKSRHGPTVEINEPSGFGIGCGGKKGVRKGFLGEDHTDGVSERAVTEGCAIGTGFDVE